MGIENSREHAGIKKTARVNGVSVDVDRLIAEAEKFPIESLPIERFSNFKSHDRGWLTTAGEDIVPKQLIDLAHECDSDYVQMLEREPTWTEHIERVRTADMTMPILVTSEFDLVDGAHRITKVFIENGDQVLAHVIPNEQLDAYRV